MIPKLADPHTPPTQYLEFLDRLRESAFSGDVSSDYAERVVLATDNSIYQILPQGVVCPRSVEDLAIVTGLANQSDFSQIVLSPRGGGTGTNGQSLTDGIVVDISKYMNKILEINSEQRWVKVQTGVVKDQLNAALKPYGLFFAPELSTSNRATIGGMINTDASGQGSCMYGKTRDHVLSLKTVFLDGQTWQSSPLNDQQLQAVCQRDDRIGGIHRLLDKIAREQGDLITEKFPKLNRCLTGYDLAHIRNEQGELDLNSVLCGSEGSLGFIAEAKLNVLPIPKFAALVNLKYTSFESSMRDAKELMQWQPTSIETIDSKVLNLAMNDIVWESVTGFFEHIAGEPQIQGINLVEYTSDDETELDAKIAKLEEHLQDVAGKAGKCFGYTIVKGSQNINKIWAMRKKAVGLLGNGVGQERPIPFVEDTAVPPENLADFIMEFRALLDSYNLPYGMFGHVDAGVLHVRPAIDMKDPKQAALIRPITDGVVKLTQKYNGLLWGEHGKGVRSEYSPAFFGELYVQLQLIKGCLDPHNQLNPGKIATPLINTTSEKTASFNIEENVIQLLKIDEVPTRGEYDRQIGISAREEFSQAMFCNGNGACYNYDPNDAMCPSWKVTRERKHSPKGRASLIRQWLLMLEKQGERFDSGPSSTLQTVINAPLMLLKKASNTRKKNKGEYDYSHEVHEAMMGCLACKSCVAQCPIKVNVPDFRSKFLSHYYQRYQRPIKDYFIASLEYLVPLWSKVPSVYNFITTSKFGVNLLRKIGVQDSPSICTHSLIKGMQQRQIEFASNKLLNSLSPHIRDKSVVLVQDAFTSYFETQLVLDVCDFLRTLGFNVFVAPFKANGKPLHVHGFLRAFTRSASKNAAMLTGFSQANIPLIGIDPSMTLTYRQEYKAAAIDAPNVMLLQEWLVSKTSQLEQLGAKLTATEYKLMAHCTEKTSAVASNKQWQQIFQLLGQQLTIEAVGCCGMAGTYGHETQNIENSKELYNMSWKKVVADNQSSTLLATGYSCRSQVKRIDQKTINHPLQAIIKRLRG
ncbi:MAG: FAD/FMN-containing dehydrogenase/Fe-S oxidoreductase [Oceanospirillaceae bacterium]|jgi:FAD/FMN-containing dehydrogenase/Fe-S oxidoreductase